LGSDSQSRWRKVAFGRLRSRRREDPSADVREAAQEAIDKLEDDDDDEPAKKKAAPKP
jgi:hypothetical protein